MGPVQPDILTFPEKRSCKSGFFYEIFSYFTICNPLNCFKNTLGAKENDFMPPSVKPSNSVHRVPLSSPNDKDSAPGVLCSLELSFSRGQSRHRRLGQEQVPGSTR